MEFWLTLTVLTSLGYSKKGWTNGEIGVNWIKHFEEQTREKAASRARLLFVDGHNSHYIVAFLTYARKHNIHILCYPSHTTHVYQGLNVAAFGVLKTCWTEARDNWERETHEKVSKNNFLSSLGKAWVKAITPETIASAWRKTGIWPFSPDIIPTDATAPSRTTTTQAAMPLLQATPIRVVACIFRGAIQETRRKADEDSDAMDIDLSDEDLMDVDLSDDNPDAHIDPILKSARHVRDELATTSASFLVSTSPIHSTSCLPEFTVTQATPITSHPLLELEPQIANEALLQEALSNNQSQLESSQNTHSEQQAMLVMQNLYCEDV